MDKLIGLFIEDEAANVDIYTRLFALEGLKLDCLDKLPLTVDGYYDIILEKNVDFLIIDFHLWCTVGGLAVFVWGVGGC